MFRVSHLGLRVEDFDVCFMVPGVHRTLRPGFNVESLCQAQRGELRVLASSKRTRRDSGVESAWGCGIEGLWFRVDLGRDSGVESDCGARRGLGFRV